LQHRPRFGLGHRLDFAQLAHDGAAARTSLIQRAARLVELVLGLGDDVAEFSRTPS
jgi:hypothetical protein